MMRREAQVTWGKKNRQDNTVSLKRENPKGIFNFIIMRGVEKK